MNRATIDPEISGRINALRLPLIISVVLIHAGDFRVGYLYSAFGNGSEPGLSQRLIYLISQVLTGSSVPMLFMLSGFLLFLSLRFTADSYICALRSRLRTLLVPFLFWNIFTLIIFALLQSLPFLQGTITFRTVIGNFQIPDYLTALFGVSGQPIAGQFWFIRDLMVLVILSPVFLLALRIPRVVLAALFVLWMLDVRIIPPVEIDSIFFFFLGALWAAFNLRSDWIDRYGLPIFLAYCILALADAASWGRPFNVPLHKVTMLTGIISIWYWTGIALGREKSKRLLIKLSPMAFFIFAAHAPMVLGGLSRLAGVLGGAVGPGKAVFLYLMTCGVTLLLTMGAFALLKKTTPSLLNMITGGRN